MSLVMWVGVHGGGICNQTVSRWGSVTPKQDGVGRWEVWAETMVCGQTCVGAQTCWPVRDQTGKV